MILFATILAAVTALIMTAVAWVMIHTSLNTKMLHAYDGPIPDDSPSVEVIIPALNEELRVADTIAKVLQQEYPKIHLTVVNDRSTDRTGEIVEELAKTLPIRVIHSAPRPFGWVGKTWAVTQGAQGASAEWLLFVDADVTLHHRTLATAIHQAKTANADLVSLIARPEIESFWQGAIAVAVGEILFTMYPTHKVNDPDSPVALAAGGFLLVKRSMYEKVGGHEAVRAEIVEDIQLGKTIKEAGGRLSVHFGPDLAVTHMYGTFRDLWLGLRKNAFAGMEYDLKKYITGAIVGQVIAWTPWIATVWGLIAGNWLLAGFGLWGIVAQAVSVAPMIPYLRTSWLFVFAMPLGSAAYTAIATSSVWHHYRGRIIWKGVTYSAREVRGAGRPDPGRADVAEASVLASSSEDRSRDPSIRP